MMINLKDNSEKDKYILELFQTSPKEAFRLLFDAYHMKLCIYAVQLTDSFEMAEDIVQDFFIYFWEKKYYLKINQNLRYYLYLSVRNAAINALQKNNMLSMEELSGIDMGIPEEPIDEEEQEERNKLLLEKRLSGNFWLLSFKISYLCLPLFYETRTTPSCHPSGCAYRQL
ncbi:hypothetical protein HMPREF1058_00868 [Phocaeicola vulgatus CL09T03C04]|uniref:RNA polymerase sigma-70 region 2 domain-containing protein n=1 Tax=Phocaeicola vulgatus CL09T03C04 TaxID=997891 RepID=I9A403_PHOVU|nr:sigma factor [Phocaeicola vulgatus]EIY82087.1 hypothetical protein HMPREF1058_00868 [Phocaeicola vulgatus CL09T03C04]